MFVLVNVDNCLKVIGPFSSIEEGQKFRRETFGPGSPWVCVQMYAPSLFPKEEVACWRSIGEGPFPTQEQAEDFRDAEVGVIARVRQTAEGWIIETQAND
jgi:hypothetical protein